MNISGRYFSSVSKVLDLTRDQKWEKQLSSLWKTSLWLMDLVSKPAWRGQKFSMIQCSPCLRLQSKNTVKQCQIKRAKKVKKSQKMNQLAPLYPRQHFSVHQQMPLQIRLSKNRKWTSRMHLSQKHWNRMIVHGKRQVLSWYKLPLDALKSTSKQHKNHTRMN